MKLTVVRVGSNRRTLEDEVKAARAMDEVYDGAGDSRKVIRWLSEPRYTKHGRLWRADWEADLAE